MSQLLDTKGYNDFYSSNQRVGTKEIKRLTKHLLDAYNRGEIEESTFQKIIEVLLCSFIEHSFENKLSSKLNRLDEKLYRSWNRWK